MTNHRTYRLAKSVFDLLDASAYTDGSQISYASNTVVEITIQRFADLPNNVKQQVDNKLQAIGFEI